MDNAESRTIVMSREELILSFQRWNVDVLEDPTKHEDPTSSIEDAELQVDALLSYTTEGHIVESMSELISQTAVSFIGFCKSRGADIPDSLFEEFLDA